MNKQTVILLFGAVNNKETVRTVILNSVQNSVAIPIKQIFTKYYSILDDFKLNIYNFRSFLNHNAPHAVIHNYINSLCDDTKRITIIDDVLFQVEYDALLKTCNVISLVCMNKDGSHPLFDVNVPDFHKINMDNIVSQLSDIPNILELENKCKKEIKKVIDIKETTYEFNILIKCNSEEEMKQIKSHIIDYIKNFQVKEVENKPKELLKKQFGYNKYEVRHVDYSRNNGIIFDVIDRTNNERKTVVYSYKELSEVLFEFYNFDTILEYTPKSIKVLNDGNKQDIWYQDIPNKIFMKRGF